MSQGKLFHLSAPQFLISKMGINTFPLSSLKTLENKIVLKCACPWTGLNTAGFNRIIWIPDESRCITSNILTLRNFPVQSGGNIWQEAMASYPSTLLSPVLCHLWVDYPPVHDLPYFAHVPCLSGLCISCEAGWTFFWHSPDWGLTNSFSFPTRPV